MACEAEHKLASTGWKHGHVFFPSRTPFYTLTIGIMKVQAPVNPTSCFPALVSMLRAPERAAARTFPACARAFQGAV